MEEEKNVQSSDQDLIARCFDLDNLSVLIGAGFSKAFDGPSMADLATSTKGELDKLKEIEESIKGWISKDLVGEQLNIERFLNRMYIRSKYFGEINKVDTLTNEIIQAVRRNIFKHCLFTPKKENLPMLFLFLNALVSRKSGLGRVNFFTLNYDLLIETCSDELAILLNDGFEGSAKRWLNTAHFDLDYFYPSGVIGEKPVRCQRVINFFKLHGSLDWLKEEGRVVKGKVNPENMLIYPNLEKYDEMAYEPFSEIFRRFSVSIKRSKGALIVIGYSFNDSHINQILAQALEQPLFHLVVIDPDVSKISKNFPESNKFSDRIKVLGATLNEFVEKYLPREMAAFVNPTEEILKSFKKILADK